MTGYLVIAAIAFALSWLGIGLAIYPGKEQEK